MLGGGGITGIAWETGILAGLAEIGLDLTDADLVVGTSAGSVVGVDIRSGLSLASLYERQTREPQNEIYAKIPVPVTLQYIRAVAFSRKPEAARRRLGKVALAAKTEPEDVRYKVIESRVPIREWPAGKLQITAVVAETGEFVVFDAASGVSIVDAVAASCAVPGVWPPVTIDGTRYIDGGMRSGTNADLAVGCERVVVIAPLTQGFGVMPSLATQVRMLTDQGVQVASVSPDKAALSAFGRNVLDPARRPAAARAGYAQAASVAAAVRAVWTGPQAG